jgi:hypothetical protein
MGLYNIYMAQKRLVIKNKKIAEKVRKGRIGAKKDFIELLRRAVKR